MSNLPVATAPFEETCKKSALKVFISFRKISMRCKSFFCSRLNFIEFGWDAETPRIRMIDEKKNIFISLCKGIRSGPS
jgi:hypothetical protein